MAMSSSIRCSTLMMMVMFPTRHPRRDRWCGKAGSSGFTIVSRSGRRACRSICFFWGMLGGFSSDLSHVIIHTVVYRVLTMHVSQTRRVAPVGGVCVCVCVCRLSFSSGAFYL
jgi:hypothetical protein